MLFVIASSAMLGFGNPEIVLAFAAVLVLFGAKRIPDFVRGLRRRLKEFGKAFQDVKRKLGASLDGPAEEAGRSAGGIHGKLAAEALTVENQTVEIYYESLWRGRRLSERAAGRFKRNFKRNFALAMGVGILTTAAMYVFFIFMDTALNF